ncbi:rRNA processing [Haematococcus lacustris]|uniref:rRNA processing n=1 Tax=Haematococcus lacustris TaxID=44745 RepID=A0A6A0A5B9_HAELA|nr:rRNA processing [Haematococcus lacustris]
MVRAKTAGKKADSNGKQLGSEQLGGKQLKGKQLESKEGPAQASVGQASRPLSRMQRLMSQAAQHKADMAAARQAKGRQQQKQAFFKRTRTGQPLMRYRVEKILQALQS